MRRRNLCWCGPQFGGHSHQAGKRIGLHLLHDHRPTGYANNRCIPARHGSLTQLSRRAAHTLRAPASTRSDSEGLADRWIAHLVLQWPCSANSTQVFWCGAFLTERKTRGYSGFDIRRDLVAEDACEPRSSTDGGRGDWCKADTKVSSIPSSNCTTAGLLF